VRARTRGIRMGLFGHFDSIRINCGLTQIDFFWLFFYEGGRSAPTVYTMSGRS